MVNKDQNSNAAYTLMTGCTDRDERSKKRVERMMMRRWQTIASIPFMVAMERRIIKRIGANTAHVVVCSVLENIIF